MIFTSESVSSGHPDKVCDQISDAILDEAIKQDKKSKVAIEALVKNNNVILAGEITSKADIDYEKITKDTIINIGYDKDEYGFNGNNCNITNILSKQSIDIANGIEETADKEQGAGDQGIMFGYACDETPTLMPAPIYYSHLLLKKREELIRNGRFSWLLPDAKSQVSCIYENNKLIAINSIVISTQHSADINIKDIREAVLEEIVKPTIPSKLIDKKIKYHINPSGNFVLGGPVADAGLTGRKIIVDTYGGMGRHGGGAFSGKDPSKVDRSASYATRWVAKNIVANGLAKKCEIQISYAIGVAEPTSLFVNTFGTNTIAEKDIVNIINNNFDLRPKEIIKMLDLQRPIYQKTASYGHFGRTEKDISWEQIIDLKD